MHISVLPNEPLLADVIQKSFKYFVGDIPINVLPNEPLFIYASLKQSYLKIVLFSRLWKIFFAVFYVD